MSPAANAISDELTLAASLRAFEAALVSPHRANIRLQLRDPNLLLTDFSLDPMEQTKIPRSWARRARRAWYQDSDSLLEFGDKGFHNSDFCSDHGKRYEMEFTLLRSLDSSNVLG